MEAKFSITRLDARQAGPCQACQDQMCSTGVKPESVVNIIRTGYSAELRLCDECLKAFALTIYVHMQSAHQDGSETRAIPVNNQEEELSAS